MRVLAARGSELEREFPFGVVRQLFEARAGRRRTARARLRRRGRRRARRCSARRRRRRRRRGDASFAALHGLYWLTLNLAAERPLLLAVDDLHWCDRPSLRFLAYLARRLEGLPILVAATLRTGEPGDRPGAARRDRARPAAARVRPGPLLERRRVRELVRERLGARRRRRASAPPATRPPAATRCCCASCSTALAADGVRPTRANAERRARDRPARRLAHGAAAPRAPAATRPSRSRAPSRCSARAPTCRRSPRSPGSTRRASPRRPARSRAPRSCAPSRRSASSTRSCATRSTATCRPASASSSTRARPRRCATPARRARAGRRPAAADAAPRATPGSSTLLHGGRPRGDAQGAAESAVAYLRRALEEPPPADRRAQLLLELGVAEVLTDGRGGGRAPARGLRRADRPAGPRAGAPTCSRAR